MSYPDIPHLQLPLRFDRGRAVVVEQDSPDDVASCVEAVLRTPVGHLDANPRFGVEDLTFRQGGADVEELRGAVERWEPRARLLAEEDPDRLAELESVIRLRLEHEA